MSKTINHNCQSCGGALNVSARGGKIQCPFCGSLNYFEPEQKNFDGILCPECGSINPLGSLHCGQCGMKFTVDCPKCGASNLSGSVYCVKCGTDIKKETIRRDSATASQLLQQTLHQAKEAKQKKKTIRVVLVISVILTVACCLVFYAAELSPSAQATATAEALGQAAATQTAVADLKSQYPYHGSNGVFSVFMQDFCVQRKESTGRWYASINFLHFQDDPKYSFNWDFSKSYLTDNLGNTFNATQADSLGNPKYRIVTDFDPSATSVVVHFRLPDDTLDEISIPVKLEDTLLTGNCSK